MHLHDLIVPLGISTYISLILTILSGILFFKFHIKWVKMKWHIWLAVITLILATSHAVLVIYYH